MRYNPNIKFNSISDITDEQVRKKMEELSQQPHVLGIQLNGSRATGFYRPDSDWDGFIYVTDEYYSSLEIKDIWKLDVDETVEPKKLLLDYLLICDEWLKQKVDSPLDIEHFAFVEAITIYDPTGKLEEWTQKLARYPEEEHETRLKVKYLQFLEARGYGKHAKLRGAKIDSKLNYYRAVVSAVNLWFTIRKSWIPPFKWWSEHARHLGMDNKTYQMFESVLDNPTLEKLDEIGKKMSKEIVEQGFEFPKDIMNTFLEFYHTSAPEKNYLHSLL